MTSERPASTLPAQSALAMPGALQAAIQLHDAGGIIRPGRANTEGRILAGNALILNLIPTPIWVAGDDGRRTYFNRAWQEFTGRTLEQELGHGWAGGIHPEDFTERRRMHLRAILKQEPWQTEYRLLDRTGAYRWVSESGSPVLSPRNDLVGFIGTCHDVTEHKEEARRNEYGKYHDGLTGLYNQHYVQHKLAECAGRENLFPMSIIVADLDGLKEVNDKRGHLVGNQLIKGAAAILGKAFRDDDIIARYGGDEFVVLLPCTEYEHAQSALLRVQHQMVKHNQTVKYTTGHQDPLVSMSLGAATAQHSGELTSTFNLADKLMYEDKRARKAGRDRLSQQ